MNPKNLSRYIDHTLLKPNITKDLIDKLCSEALEYNFASVCIPPYYVSHANELLKESETVKVCTVIGFPLGYDNTASKVESIKKAIEQGADELDAVVNIPAIKDGDWKTVRYDLESMSTVVQRNDKLLKIIFETCYLTNDEIEKLSEICLEYGVDYLKTSTGFGTGGANIEHVKLMKKIAGDKAKIKASGGVRTQEDALKMIEAGADRIGASAGIKIVEG
jgi:deoxyribose-phosphate aldolase